MSKSAGWLPNSRDGISATADDWITAYTAKQAGWNIPGPALTELASPRDAAAALETAENETARTPAAQRVVIGSAAGPADKGCRIWYIVIALDETPLADSGGLRKSFYTKRKKDAGEFELEDSGKTAFFAAQIENEGEKSPWGPAGIGIDTVMVSPGKNE
jgi:hypothetical protein